MTPSTASLRAASGAALLLLLAAGCSKSPTVVTVPVTPTPAAVAQVPANTMPRGSTPENATSTCTFPLT